MPTTEPVCSYDGALQRAYKFTGKERDGESGLDYFIHRHYASTLGRFMQPDPAGMMAVEIGSPQTLNRYTYVLNNPLSFTDPFGLDCAYLNSSGTEVERGGIDQHSSSGECGRTGGYWVEGRRVAHPFGFYQASRAPSYSPDVGLGAPF